MSEADSGLTEKAERRAARERVAAYHHEELGKLLERVRDGFARLDAGEIDVFDLDAIVHRYQRAAKRLWLFCGSSGAQWTQAASALALMRDRGEPPPDWWAVAAPERD